MITSPAFRGKRYAVLGLARSGAATVRSLVASGADVVGWDDNEATLRTLFEQLKSDRQEIGAEPKFTSKNWLLAKDLAGFDAIVVSPGVPLNRHPVAEKAARYGVPIIGDIELFAQARSSLPAHKVIGITGTNGKSTTTALIHHIVKTAGIPTTLGGNIGLPILGQEPLPEGGVYVLELSSYQIDLTQSLDCDVGVLLNITPDHLDRYDGFAGYAASKARLFTMMSEQHIAVIATEDDETRSIANVVRHCRESATSTLIEVSSASITDQSQWPTLQGPHNAQNAVVAIAAACALGIPEEAIQEGLKTYPGLPHRMERVKERGGVLFVNDSKATNPSSSSFALASYPAIHWILGGLPKGDRLDECVPMFDHVRAAYTIGEAGPTFARLLREAGKPVTESGTLAQAVSDAAAAAQPGEVVLLSPACASFDQFRDYEARGDAFRAAVGALA
jgi:UDP-N-acetylmuramoylalanine--D-glutamate ligase